MPLKGSAPGVAKYVLYPVRDSSKPAASVFECELNEVTKRLNVPFDEVVYPDLISIDTTISKCKPDEKRPRKLKTLDPEPQLENFCQPSKNEFLSCDVLVRNFGMDGQNCDSFFDSNAKACNPNGGKFPESADMELENVEEETHCVEKFRRMHAHYGLDPPKLRSHFDGSYLYKRSLSWKVL